MLGLPFFMHTRPDINFILLFLPLAAFKTCFFINLSHCEKIIVTRFFRKWIQPDSPFGVYFFSHLFLKMPLRATKIKKMPKKVPGRKIKVFSNILEYILGEKYFLTMYTKLPKTHSPFGVYILYRQFEIYTISQRKYDEFQ